MNLQRREPEAARSTMNSAVHVHTMPPPAPEPPSRSERRTAHGRGLRAGKAHFIRRSRGLPGQPRQRAPHRATTRTAHHKRGRKRPRGCNTGVRYTKHVRHAGRSSAPQFGNLHRAHAALTSTKPSFAFSADWPLVPRRTGIQNRPPEAPRGSDRTRP